jgi:hypothetical protein
MACHERGTGSRCAQAGDSPPAAACYLRPMANPLSRLTTALTDRYRIERELGARGMASAYLAHDLKHDRKVAIRTPSQ